MAFRITKTTWNFEREPLIRPFGFKGGYMKEIWQVVSLLKDDEENRGWGLGSQSVLWSDSRVFASNSEAGGNVLMAALTGRALQMAETVEMDTPVDLMDQIFEELCDYGQSITGMDDLRKTFVLNALVSVDIAAWMLYAKRNRIESLDQMIPADYRPALSHRHRKVADIPVCSYGMSVEEIGDLVKKEGYFMLKLKLGTPGSQEDMLANDMERLEQIHRAVGDERIPYTENGKLPYYLDINGRYEQKETLLKLLDHTRKIGAFDQILLVEEPFPEEADFAVGDTGVLVAADESAHTEKNVRERIEMGYGAIALKPIAKTLSMTLKMAKEAHRHNVPCFCADLTVNPILVEWNKNIAARLQPLPGLEVGLLETNGHQNYRDWDRMKRYHPRSDSPWAVSDQGIFHLTDEFYGESGGIFLDSPHYLSLVNDRK